MWYKDRGWDLFIKYIKFARFILILSFTLILSRVFQIQVFKGYRFSKKSQENYLKKFIIAPKRGNMVSSDGEILATTYVSYNLVSQSPPTDSILEELSSITGVPVKKMKQNICEAQRKKEILVTLANDLKGRPLIAVASRIDEYPDLRIIKAPKRFYPYEKIFSHVTGYLGEPTKSEISEMPYSYTGSLHGQSGIEKTYDKYLFGKAGGEIVEVTASGNIVEVKGSVPPSSGDEVRLTVDSRLQRAAFEAFNGRPGAAIALNPKTGAIRLLVSSPGFKPSVFVDRSEEVARLMTAPEIPLVNRAIQMKYPPGSAFKIITSAAALSEGCIKTDTQFECDGIFEYADREFKCWKEQGHGIMDFMQGFANSCNIYFYNVGLKTGGENLSKYAKMMGLDLNVFEDISGELESTIPGPAWKKKKLKRGWWNGDSINMAIGQGFLWVTPMQMALVVSGLATRGVIYKPYIVEKVISAENDIEYASKPEIAREYKLSDRTFELLKKAMRKTVLEGTGRILDIKDYEIYGKTGTAQNPNGEDHGWFVSYGGGALSDFCLVVVVEHGGMGSVSAGPIARIVWDEYIKIKADAGQEKVNEKN